MLARITGDSELARAVPLLRPEVLHAVITHCGLQDCGELLALATDEQLSAVFDLDLWKANRAGADEQFDVGRFCEWLEVLVDDSPAIAAERLAKMDVALVVAGLSPHLSVWDPAVFSPDGEPSGADSVSNAGRERGVHAEIGGYLVVARRPEAWDAIVEVLLALVEHHLETFERVMRRCRRLTNAGWELDGLHDLSSDAEQGRFDLSFSRELRRDRLGFLPPPQARAFLDSARHASLMAPPQAHLVFTAHQRASAVMTEETLAATAPCDAEVDEQPDDTASAVATVVDVLRAAGILADTSRALLPAAQDDASSPTPALNRYLQICADSDDSGWAARNQELAFLANALVGGCSVQGRTFAPREATEAVAATCNLGLECWPQQWSASAQHDLVTVFQVGWTILHREVSMVAAAQLLTGLDQVRTSDRDVQLGLHALRRELQKRHDAGVPWRVRDRLDVLAAFDLPAWAALTALFDECPVMLANVSADKRPHAVNPSEFQFVANARHIARIHGFLRSLPELFTC